MESLFLLSDASSGDAHQLLRSFSQNPHPIIAFAKNHEIVTSLQEEHPSVIWIIFDITRNTNSVVRFLRVLPTPQYIVNFSGQSFSNASLEALKSQGQIYKQRERGRSEITVDGIVDEDDGHECKIFVNVVEKSSGLKRKSKTFSKTVGKLVKGAKKKISDLTHDDDSSSEENQPLITTRAGAGYEHDYDTPQQGFILSLLSACCPCFFTPPEPDYCFHNVQELRAQMQSEHLLEIQEALQKLIDKSFFKWTVALSDLDKKKTLKVEDLAANIDAMREDEEKELNSVKDTQNRNTRENLSNVLSPDILKKIEQSRSRQTKGKVEYDADRAFREGETLILKQVDLEKAQLQERHYSSLVEEQLRKLCEINTKYQKKSQTLQARYFGNRV